MRKSSIALTSARLGLSILVAAYSVVRGRATRPPARVRKVLVVQMAKLGDMVCTTPVFRALKAHAPETGVWVLGSAINEQVIAGNPDVEGYIVFDGILSALKRLRAERFDAAVIAGGPDHTSAAICFLAGIPLIVVPEIEGGTSRLFDGWFHVLSLFVARVPHRMGTYAPREYLRLLEPLGIHADDTSKFVYSTPEAQARMHERLDSLSHPRIGIAPGSGNKIKRWPSDRFAELADQLIDTHSATIVLFGSPRDEEEAHCMLSSMRHAADIIDLRGDSIDDLKAAIPHLDLFVSVDTGPIYIAEATGVATVDIVGPVDEHEQPPIGKRHSVVVPPYERVPQLHIMDVNSYDPAETERQILSITVPMTYGACEKLLASA